jgi:ATP-dependent Lhr-like helicase
VQGRWSLTAPLFAGGLQGAAGATGPSPTAERRRTLAELLLERYGIVTREQVLAEGVAGGFAVLYDTFCNLETLGICRRGYFIEGMGGAQFALPGAVERLRAAPPAAGPPPPAAGRPALGQAGEDAQDARTLVLAAADPAQPYGAALPWPHRPRRGKRAGAAPGDGAGAEAGRESGGGRPARVAGAYVVLVDDRPVLYVERGGRGLLTLVTAPAGTQEADLLPRALAALARAARAGRIGKLALERIDGRPAIGSELADLLVELGFHPGPRRLTLSA